MSKLWPCDEHEKDYFNVCSHLTERNIMGYWMFLHHGVITWFGKKKEDFKLITIYLREEFMYVHRYTAAPLALFHIPQFFFFFWGMTYLNFLFKILYSDVVCWWYAELKLSSRGNIIFFFSLISKYTLNNHVFFLPFCLEGLSHLFKSWIKDIYIKLSIMWNYISI